VTSQITSHATGPAKPARWVPFVLATLFLIPIVAGSLRVLELSGGPLLLPENPRMTASPAPVVVHIISAITYLLLGAVQFSARFRRRWPRWHRRAGAVLMLLGLAVAFSGLWMTAFYDRQPGTGELAYIFRLLFGTGMAASIILGFAAIRRTDVARHRMWMTRAYALALGAGTQIFTLGIGEAVFGPGELTHDLMLGTGWALNLLAAEYLIRNGNRTGNRAEGRAP
jgi:uncharacterized membrane protein